MWENSTHIHAFHFPDKDRATQNSVSRKFRLTQETILGKVGSWKAHSRAALAPAPAARGPPRPHPCFRSLARGAEAPETSAAECNNRFDSLETSSEKQTWPWRSSLSSVTIWRARRGGVRVRGYPGARSRGRWAPVPATPSPAEWGGGGGGAKTE